MADEEDNDEDDEQDDEDVWDEDGIDPDAMEGMCSLNPFISDAPHQNKSIRIINLPKAQTIQMLKEHSKQQDVAATGGGATAASSYLDKLKESATVKPLYEDTDSDSRAAPCAASSSTSRSRSRCMTTIPSISMSWDASTVTSWSSCNGNRHKWPPISWDCAP